MSAHAAYVAAAYGAAIVVLAALVAWLLVDQHKRRRDLDELEAAGVHRRSDRQPETAL